jgi:hypothetical protein
MQYIETRYKNQSLPDSAVTPAVMIVTSPVSRTVERWKFRVRLTALLAVMFGLKYCFAVCSSCSTIVSRFIYAIKNTDHFLNRVHFKDVLGLYS